MRSLLVIDDDDLSREVLALLARQEGFSCVEAESGEAALEGLGAPGAKMPDAVLADCQMPGVTGESLARLLRLACGPRAALLAMSGSQPDEQTLRGFDGFLLKPFTMADLEASIAGVKQRLAHPAGADVLNHAVYASLAASMPPAQVQALYAMCLDDAERRLHSLEAAAQARDAEAYARAAHSIKGGCGMVGAAELAHLAGAMEAGGLPEVDNKAPFTDFLAALARLRRMLDAQTE